MFPQDTKDGSAERASTDRRSAVDPSFVYDTLEEYGTASHKEMLSRGSQEDAQESLNHILLLIHEEMAKAEATIRDDHDGRTNGVDGQWNDEWTNINKKQKKSIMRSCVDFKDTPISGVFGGKLRSIRKHQGAKEFENVEPFFMLDLPIQVRTERNASHILDAGQWIHPDCFLLSDARSQPQHRKRAPLGKQPDQTESFSQVAHPTNQYQWQSAPLQMTIWVKSLAYAPVLV